MAYPFSFHRLVLGGSLYTERWNTSLSIAGPGLPAVSSTMLASIAGIVGTWFATTGTNGPNFTSAVKLTDLKLNRINEAGKYQDPVSMTHTYTTPIAGPSAGSPAPQLACVVTLKTGFDRGRASRGRMFLPPPSGYISTADATGRVATSDALRVANSVATLINSLRAGYVAQYGPGPDSGGVAVMSDIGAGSWHFVTRVEVGRVIDTMRSRRTSLVEDRQVATTAVVVPSSVD